MPCRPTLCVHPCLSQTSPPGIPKDAERTGSSTNVEACGAGCGDQASPAESLSCSTLRRASPPACSLSTAWGGKVRGHTRVETLQTEGTNIGASPDSTELRPSHVPLSNEYRPRIHSLSSKYLIASGFHGGQLPPTAMIRVRVRVSRRLVHTQGRRTTRRDEHCTGLYLCLAFGSSPSPSRHQAA